MSTPTRPGPSAGISSPQTPQRGLSSTFSSPGFRTEDDTVIFEIGTRYFRAGLANDSVPRCSLDYGPEQSRRLGDYRRWLPGFEDRPRIAKQLEKWTKDYELWQLDLRNTDLGLMLDKLERVIRRAYSEHLLIDAKSKKVVLVIQAITPHTVLSRILNLIFVNFQMSSVVLLPPSTMAVVAAGQRSGLVVDIGWHETIITAVYELREIADSRSTRAMKLLTKEAVKFLQGYIRPKNTDEEPTVKTSLDFEYVEELMTQIFWCRSSSQVSTHNDHPVEAEDTTITVPLPLPSSRGVKISFLDLCRPVEDTLLTPLYDPRKQDDNEHDLVYLMFRALLGLAPDVRSVCMSRIIFTGGGANIPGLKSRLLEDMRNTIEKRGWSQVWPSTSSKGQAAMNIRFPANFNAQSTKPKDSISDSKQGAAFEDQIYDPYEEKFYKAAAKLMKPGLCGVVGAIETMGAFAGASITAALRIKSPVEIERELFLQHGLHGPKKERDSITSRGKSIGGVYAKPSAIDTPAWTLGAFA